MLLVSIISPSCDSKPKPGPNQSAPTEQTATEVAPAEKAKPQESPAKQSASEETHSEEAPKEESSIQEMPAEDGVTGEAPTEESTTEQSSTEGVASEHESPVDEVTQSKRELLHMLRKLKQSAIAQEDQENAESLELEIQQVMSALNEIETAKKTKQEALAESESVQITESNSEVIEQPSEPVATDTREEKPTPVELPDSTPVAVEASPYEKDIERLVKLRDSEKSKAEAPIQKRFDFAAQQLLRKFTQAGKLDAAIKLKELIGTPEAMANLAQEAGTIHEKELARLIAQRDREMATAMLPIQKRFDLGAQQLIRKATQTDDIESAIKLKALIEEAKNAADSAPVETVKKPKISDNSDTSSSSSKVKESSEKDFEYKFQGESVEITKYVGKSNRVSVPAMIQGLPVTSVGGYTFDKEVKEVLLPDNIKNISYNAFFGCTKLKELKIPASVRSIRNSPTSLCISLESIEVDPANENFASVDGVLYNKDLSQLINCPAGLKMQTLKVPDTVKLILSNSFHGAKLKTLHVPNDARISEDAFKYSNIRVIRY